MVSFASYPTWSVRRKSCARRLMLYGQSGSDLPTKSLKAATTSFGGCFGHATKDASTKAERKSSLKLGCELEASQNNPVRRMLT